MSSTELLIFSARHCENGILTLGGVDKLRTEIGHIERGSGMWPLTTETHLKTQYIQRIEPFLWGYAI